MDSTQAPDFDADSQAHAVVGLWRCHDSSGDEDLRRSIAATLRYAYAAGQRVAIANNCYQRAPEVAALIKAAKRYTDKCDESSIDRLCDAAWALEEAGATEAIQAAPARPHSPVLAALIDAANAYAAHKRANEAAGRLGSTYSTELAIDALIAAAVALAEEN